MLPSLVVLLIAVVLVGFWMLYQRLRLIEDRVRLVPREDDLEQKLLPLVTDLASLQSLREDVRRLREQTEQADPPLGASDLEPLESRLAELESSVGDLARQLELAARRREPGADPVDPLSVALYRRLEREGFDQVRVLVDLESLDPAEEHRIPVEARRRGAVYKGFVGFAGGAVADVSMNPSYEAFP